MRSRSSSARAMTKAARRYAVTGAGLATPVGIEVPAVLSRVLWGPPAAGPITTFDVSRCLSRIGAPARAVALPAGDGVPMSRGTALLIVAIEHALADAGVDDPGVLALCIGGGGGDCALADDEALRPDLFLPCSVPSALEILARRWRFDGPRIGVYGASASGAQAVAEAAWLLAHGEAEMVLACGYDAMLNAIAFGALDGLGLLSCRNDEPATASRPFDARRDGFVLGEGAGALVLETEAHAVARGTRVQGWLLGVGVANGAHHWIEPPWDPSTAAETMQAALSDAAIDAAAVDHVLAYGSSSPAYDALETRALKAVFGGAASAPSVSSTKGALGYLAGAAGIVDAIIALGALRTQVVPPTLNYAEPDPECDLDYVPGRPRRKRLHTVLCNALGLGAQYVSLVLAEARS
jgi:3-oxoacyl-[acyl-carrier-protein] synthase II